MAIGILIRMGKNASVNILSIYVHNLSISSVVEHFSLGVVAAPSSAHHGLLKALPGLGNKIANRFYYPPTHENISAHSKLSFTHFSSPFQSCVGVMGRPALNGDRWIYIRLRGSEYAIHPTFRIPRATNSIELNYIVF